MDTIIKNPTPNHVYVYTHQTPNQLCERLGNGMAEWATLNRAASLADARRFLDYWLRTYSYKYSGMASLLTVSADKRYERAEGLTETYFFVEYKTHRQRDADTVLMVIIYEDQPVKDETAVALADAIKAFINDPARRPGLSVSGLETMAGIPARDLHKFLDGKRGLPAKHTDKLADVLTAYGFVKSVG